MAVPTGWSRHRSPRGTGQARDWVRAARILTLMLLAAPVLAGLAGAVLPAFGYLPALGGKALSLAPWQELAAWPGLGAAVRLSLVTGLVATIVSLAITVLIVAAWQGTRSFRAITRALAPLLALPHAAAAFGLAFLVTPSGWVARALSPWATGWERPPDLLIVGDPAGMALIAGLVVKEVPFLMLMTLAALGQADSQRSALVAQSLGYGTVAGWLKVVLPRVYPQIRLPVLAVLAYSMSVVDVALILGPTRPPTLAVQILDWMGDPDLSMRFRASAAAVLQLLLVLGAVALWIGGERGAAALGRRWAEGGGRGHLLDAALRPLALGLAGLIGLAVLLGLAGLGLWSVAGLWRFPDLWPESFRLSTWSGQARGLGAATMTTVMIGLTATLLALGMSVACLEAEFRASHRGPRNRWLVMLYLPLIVPQVAFLPGLTTLALVFGVDGSVAAVTLAHLVFVLPYVLLSLADPWRAWDTRCATVGRALGASDARVLWTLRLPMLTRAVMIAAAVGFATSVAQYLPTLLIGAGRVETLTTQAVALAAGSNRRLIGVWAFAQMLLPLVVFLLALALPRLAFANRRGMQVE